MIPFNQLERLLSTEGLLDLRTTFSPPEGAYMVTYHQEDDTYRFSYFTHDTLDERSGSYSFALHLKKELGSALEILFSEIDRKLFSINVEIERQSFASLSLKRLNLIIHNWSTSSSSLIYPETLTTLNNFGRRIENLLHSYISSNDFMYEKKDQEVVLQLPEGFKLPQMKLKAERLNLRQTALLFDYLLEHKVILKYNDSSLAKIVSVLTGHSPQNLRAEGFGLIRNIKRGWNKEGVRKQDTNKDLNELKDLLLSIVKELDNESQKNLK